MPLLSVWPDIFPFILNQLVSALSALKSVIALLLANAGSSLQYCHEIPYGVTIHWHYYINIMSITCLRIVYSAYAVSKCCIVF